MSTLDNILRRNGIVKVGDRLWRHKATGVQFPGNALVQAGCVNADYPSLAYWVREVVLDFFDHDPPEDMLRYVRDMLMRADEYPDPHSDIHDDFFMAWAAGREYVMLGTEGIKTFVSEKGQELMVVIEAALQEYEE
jgi:hypothetical protein